MGGVHPMLGHIALATAIPSGQGLKQVGELGLAFGLSSLIGLEREWRQKSAGLRTHTLVGFGAALFLLVSKYGFSDVLVGSHVAFDPSRVAAQIVSGLGFIGGGLIFVRGDAVRGLTTAATVWLTAAIGMACGAGLAILALISTLAYFITIFFYRWIAVRLPRSSYTGFGLRVVYADGRGVLRDVLAACTDQGFTIARVATRRLEGHVDDEPAVAVDLEVVGQPHPETLAARLSDLPGVHEVSASDFAVSD
jgi:putative Mg2+ transporter-C (MgtC) family protein